MVLENIVYMPVLVIGVVLAVYEMIAIQAEMDFRGSQWFIHGLTAVLFMFIGLFAIFNWEYFLEITTLAGRNIPLISNVLVGRIVIGIILNIEMHAASSIAHGGALYARGMSEHWFHTTLISVLAVAAPYYWPFIAPFLPAWLI